MTKTDLKTALITLGAILLVDIAGAAALCYWDGVFNFFFVLPPIMLISLLIGLVSVVRKNKLGTWMWLSNILLGPVLSLSLYTRYTRTYVSYISKKMPVEMEKFYEANKDQLWTTARYFSSIMGDSICYCDIQKCDNGYRFYYESALNKKDLEAISFDSLKCSLAQLGHDSLRIDTLRNMMHELGSENICYRHDTIPSMSNGVALSYRYELRGYYCFAFRDKETVFRGRKIEFTSPNFAPSITYNDSVLFYHTQSLFGFEDFPGKEAYLKRHVSL